MVRVGGMIGGGKEEIGGVMVYEGGKGWDEGVGDGGEGIEFIEYYGG
ncbi:hypothetical protein [Staphylococcus hominis]